MLNDSTMQFSKSMRKTHTILVPMMLPVHFAMLVQIFNDAGYHVELLNTTGRALVEEGLKNVHNDTCYPALLVIGQLINALKSGKYDPDTTAVMLTQTGGGCRASNYVYLLKKALQQSGFANTPVISLNADCLQKDSGFYLSPKTLIKAMYAINYGDMLTWVSNQCKPYEVNKGDTQKVIDNWTNTLCHQFHTPLFFGVKRNYAKILANFSAIKRRDGAKIRVGIVGEIYMKYSPLGNNELEKFLINEGAEPVVSGLLDFCLYCLQNNINDSILYGKGHTAHKISTLGLKYLQRWQNKMIHAIQEQGEFRAPSCFANLIHAARGYIETGAKMGEGWLLTAEMVELIQSGVNNVVCTQPFGCLPNHIVAKGMMRKVKDHYPTANIVAVDYDPSATAINQENRLKLMLANAKLSEQFAKADAAPSTVTTQPITEAKKIAVNN